MIGNSTNDRNGCYDSDGDGYSNKDNQWSYSDGADGYPDDPTRWGPPPSSDSSSFGTVAIAGGSVLILVILGSILFLRGRKKEPTMMPSQMGYHNQQINQGTHNKIIPAVNNHQVSNITQHHQQPAVQSDPARDYYQNLVSQGYPHEHAVAYTQQYFPHFQG